MKGYTISELKIGDNARQTNKAMLNSAKEYAKITGDRNPIHFDSEEARNSRFGEPIVHGMILGGYISGVIGTAMPGFGCLYEKQTLHFLKPVFYDDEITTVVTVKKIITERNRIILETECFNQNGEKVLTGEAMVLPRKR